MYGESQPFALELNPHFFQEYGIRSRRDFTPGKRLYYCIENDNVTWQEMCEQGILPTAKQLFASTSNWVSFIILTNGLIFFGITLFVFVDLNIFMKKHFDHQSRRARTIWILAVYPIFSACGLLAAVVPRAGTIIDLVTDVYLSTCLYQFMGLMVDYIGNLRTAWPKVKNDYTSLRGPPVCCCCFCLPMVKVTRRNMWYFAAMVMQLVITKPILSFIAAVMWADGAYIPGYIAADNAYVYIAVFNVISSAVAVYGLTILRHSFQHLMSPHLPGRKFLPLQCLLLLTVIPNLLINLLVSFGIIPCLQVLPSQARGDRIYHLWLVVLMVPLSIMSYYFYRRKVDGVVKPKNIIPEPDKVIPTILLVNNTPPPLTPSARDFLKKKEKFRDNKPFTKIDESSDEDEDTTTNEKKSSTKIDSFIAEHGLPVLNFAPPIKGNVPSTEDYDSSSKDNESIAKDNESPAKDNEPPTEDNEPPSENNDPFNKNVDPSNKNNGPAFE